MDGDGRDDVAAALAAVIRAALPEAVEGVKWNGPNFAVDGRDLVTVSRPPRGPARVVFHRGAKAVDTRTGERILADVSGRLTWATDQRASAGFADRAAVEEGEAWLAGVCRAWIEANRPA